MRGFHVYLAIGVVALLLVAVAVYYAQQKVGLVAVIRIKGYILTSDAADYYRSLIKSASENGRVKAVVVVVDSFGGYSNYVEQLYLSLKHLNGRKPVVAVAVNALSGGYYICAAASYIFAHPSSFVGAVGVISTAPPLLVPSEVVLETGPYKHTGFSRLLFFSNLSHALDAFLSAIEEGRGPRLRASREELSRGLVYLGTEAVKLGLVDAIGTLDQAVEEAARRAGLAVYRVVELGEGEGPRGSYYSWSNVTASLLESLHPPPALYYAYVPATALASGQPWQWPAPVASGGKVVVDLSHGNLVSWWSLDALLAELAQRNVTASFYSSWSEVERALDGAACLVVAAPTRPYSEAEVERVEEFVRRGGVLLLLFDPSYEYVGPQGLSNYVTAPINSLAARFGVTFSYGFLYSESDYYGIYRNVRVRDFSNATLFKGVRELVLFTAAAVRSRHAAAWVSNTTYLSAAEVQGRYAVIALASVGNGTVVAVGDITMFSEPYCRVADNYALISNLADLVASAARKGG
jgi:signal peptide peptidase SppA